MVSERNRVLELTSFLENLGIEINIKKNKARGNKGFFRVANRNYRIDISKNIHESEILKTLTHEFAHFIHYNYDKTLKNLDFLFDSSDKIIWDELIEITVESIPKSSIEPLFKQSEATKQEIKALESKIKDVYPQFTANSSVKYIDDFLKKSELYYLTKYDNVKILNGFSSKVISIANIDEACVNTPLAIKEYLVLKSRQRYLKRVNSKISRLNRYYNSPTELFARAVENYFINKELLYQKAPNTLKILENAIMNNKLPLLSDYAKIYNDKN